MVRLLLWLIALGALGWGAATLSNVPGTVTIALTTHQIDMPLSYGIGLVALSIAVVVLTFEIVRMVFGAPQRFSETRRDARISRGLASLRLSLIELADGKESRQAGRLARKAERALGRDGLGTLISLQAARQEGNESKIERTLTALKDHDDTKLLALKGLSDLASRNGDAEKAHSFAEEALTIDAKADWALELQEAKLLAAADQPAEASSEETASAKSAEK